LPDLAASRYRRLHNDILCHLSRKGHPKLRSFSNIPLLLTGEGKNVFCRTWQVSDMLDRLYERLDYFADLH
jgi:hypothetical protein